MTEAGLLLAINLALGLTLFGVFLGLHFYRPTDGQHIWFSLGFLAALASGMLEMALPYLHSSLLARYAIFVSFLICELLLLEGLQRLYHVRVDSRLLYIVFVGGLLLNVGTLFMERGSLLRMVLYQLPYVVMALLCAWTVFWSGRSGFGNRMLGTLFVLFAVHFASRPVAALLSGGIGATASDYLSTIYAVTTQFDVALLAIAIAVTLIGLTITDILGGLEKGLRHDPLTGIFNRAGFDAALRSRLAEAATRSSCLIACDLDYFKSINDTYGHAVGDAVIRHFAQLLSDNMRKQDLCGRIGGEEFSVYLHNLDLHAARLFVESMRIAFAAHPIDGLQEGMGCTASFGITEIDSEQEIKEAFGRADRALYAAKRKGRNRTEVESRVGPFRDGAGLRVV